jgi:hypothetical protein
MKVMMRKTMPANPDTLGPSGKEVILGCKAQLAVDAKVIDVP